MATFGSAPKSLICAADALRAVDELIVVSKRWQKERRDSGLRPLEVGFAVATGPVIFGAVGDPNRLEYTVIGDAVNLAAKLEKHNKVAGAVALIPNCDEQDSSQFVVRSIATQAFLAVARARRRACQPAMSFTQCRLV